MVQVIFIDEIDAIAPSRSEGTGGASNRLVAALLTEMDALQGRYMPIRSIRSRTSRMHDTKVSASTSNVAAFTGRRLRCDCAGRH